MKERWLPIASAPRNGQRILLSDGYEVTQGHYGLYGRWDGADPEDFGRSKPTHWMPLPLPPRPA